MASSLPRFLRSLSRSYPALFAHFTLIIRAGHVLTAWLGLEMIKILTPTAYPAIASIGTDWVLIGTLCWLVILPFGTRRWRRAWKSGAAISTKPVIYRERAIQHASYFLLIIVLPSTVILSTHTTTIPAYLYFTMSCMSLFMTTPALTWLEETYVGVAAEIKQWPQVPNHSILVPVSLYALSNFLMAALLSILPPSLNAATFANHFIVIQAVWVALILFSFWRLKRAEHSIVTVVRAAQKGDLPSPLAVKTGARFPMFHMILQTLDRLRQNITRLQHHSSEMHAAAKLIVDISQEQNQSILSQSSSVSQTSVTLNAMVESSKEIADKASTVVSMADDTEKRSGEGLNNMTESVRQLSGVREKNQSALSDIVQLSETIREIEQVLELVTSIADDTNLIALNAAIEASSAGEHGKRFKIVAQEVRELSDRVTRAIEKTRTLIEGIHESTQRLVQTSIDNVEQTDLAFASAETTYQLLQDISSWAKRSAEAARQIYVAIQHQRLSNQQICGSFDEIAGEIKGLANTSQRYREYAQTLKKFSSSIEEVLRQYRPSPDGDGFL